MFERSEEEATTELVSEAKQKAVSRDAKVPTQEVVTEETTSNQGSSLVSEYLNELNRK